MFDAIKPVGFRVSGFGVTVLKLHPSYRHSNGPYGFCQILPLATISLCMSYNLYIYTPSSIPGNNSYVIPYVTLNPKHAKPITPLKEFRLQLM